MNTRPPVTNFKRLLEIADLAHMNAFRAGLKEIENLARLTLKNYTNLHEFVMSMGRWGFTTKDNDHISPEYGPKEKCFELVEAFINEHDGKFGFTGYPMRFTLNSPVRNDW